jgi:peptidoglycan hydrolase CwlO-like protein
MSFDPKKLEEIDGDIETVTEMLDEAQKHFDENKHLWTETEAWHIQAQIDRQRFEVESRKLVVGLLKNFAS